MGLDWRRSGAQESVAVVERFWAAQLGQRERVDDDAMNDIVVGL